MLTPLKTRYSSVVKDKITEISTPKRTKPKLFLFNSISPQKDKTIKANSSIKVKMYKEIFKKSNSICNIFEYNIILINLIVFFLYISELFINLFHFFL